MARAPKKSLADLPIGRRSETAAGSKPAAKAATAAPAKAQRGAPGPRDQDRDFKSIMARINRKGWQQLRMLSAQLDMPVEDMIVDALNGFLRQHGAPAIIEKRRPYDPAGPV